MFFLPSESWQALDAKYKPNKKYSSPFSKLWYLNTAVLTFCINSSTQNFLLQKKVAKQKTFQFCSFHRNPDIVKRTKTSNNLDASRSSLLMFSMTISLNSYIEVSIISLILVEVYHKNICGVFALSES